MPQFDIAISFSSTSTFKHEVRKLASRQIITGDRGSVQDLMNFVFSALSENPELCDKLYSQGRRAFVQLHEERKPARKTKKKINPMQVLIVSP